LLARDINPHSERKRKRRAIVLAGEHTFMAVYKQWLTHRRLTLEEGRQTSLEQIPRIFENDVFPVLRHMNIHDITRAHLKNAMRCRWRKNCAPGSRNCSPTPR